MLLTVHHLSDAFSLSPKPANGEQVFLRCAIAVPDGTVFGIMNVEPVGGSLICSREIQAEFDLDAKGLVVEDLAEFAEDL